MEINDDVVKILLYYSFNSRPNKKYISEDGFELFEDIMLLTEKDIRNISKAFSVRTGENGRIIFGLLWNNLPEATVHWVQDFRRIIKDPTLDDTEENSTCKENIDAASVQRIYLSYVICENPEPNYNG